MLKFKDNYPLKNVTTLSIGGPAKKFVKVSTQAELIKAIEYAINLQIPYLVIGGGSNLLVSDEGVDCLVIKNETSGIKTSEVNKETSEVKVKSGTSLQTLVDFAINNGLSGLQKLTGIPGTVGGAVYGNAGAYGQTISDHIKEVVILSEAKNLILCKNECSFNYRDSIFKKNHNIILEVTFQLNKADPAVVKQVAKEVLEKRLIKYPPGIKCPGSFFKNLVVSEIPQEILKSIPPEKIIYGKLPAGALLEEV